MKKIPTPDVIVIIGAGGVSFYAAVALLRDTQFPIIVFDADTVSGTGATRLPYSESEHTLKTTLLSAFSVFSMGGRDPITDAEYVYSAPQILRKVQEQLTYHQISTPDPPQILIVDGSDMNYPSKKSVFGSIIAGEYPNMHYLRGSYDGNGWAVVAHDLPFTAPNDQGGYSVIPTLAQSLVAGGALAQAVIQATKGEPIPYEYQVNTNTGECLSTWREE